MGKVHGRTTARHTSADFVAFLSEIVASCPARQEIHIILDNLSAHKTKLVRDFLADHSNLKLHLTSTYSSWLNQVEVWFARIEREVISRGVFSSLSDLAQAPPIHPRLLRPRQTLQMEILRSNSPH